METYRQFFPITEQKVYLNHAAVSPISTKVKQALDNFFTIRSQEQPGNWTTAVQIAAELKEMFAEIINAESSDRIAFTQNTTHGLNIIASGLQWNSGDEILIPENEFPANVYPFKNLERKGVRIKFLPVQAGGITPAILKSNIAPKTKLLTLSFVEFLSGYKHNLEQLGQICRQNNILFIVDSIQGVGAIPIDVQKSFIDGMANGGHKWLMSPQGTGFLYVTENLQNKIRQSHLGWTGLQDMQDFMNFDRRPRKSAGRYELGTLNFAGIAGAHAALSLLTEVGIENIYSHVVKLTDYAIEKLESHSYKIYSNQNPEYRSGILSFYPKKDPQKFFNRLQNNNIVCSLREGLIRIAPHFYNNIDDIDRFIKICQ